MHFPRTLSDGRPKTARNVAALALTLALPITGHASESLDVMMTNQGLENDYRIYFEDDYTTGYLEILGDQNNREWAHTRIPFASRMKAGEEKGTEEVTLLLGRTSLSFWKPFKGPEADSSIVGTFYNRGTDNPGLELKVWDYEGDHPDPLVKTLSFGSTPGGGGEAELDNETLGGLKLGMSEAEVRKIVTQQLFKGEVSFEGATGLWVSDWISPELGLALEMAATEEKGPVSLDAVFIKAPSDFLTSRGIGIGSTREAVAHAYGKLKSEEDSDESTFVAGSVFGGVIFNFDDDGQVENIFLGAASE